MCVANVLRRRSALEIDPNKLVKPGEDVSPEVGFNYNLIYVFSLKTL